MRDPQPYIVLPWDPFYQHGLNLTLAWISDHMLSKVWDEITHPLPNFHICTIKRLEQTDDFNLGSTMDVIICTFRIKTQSVLVKGAHRLRIMQALELLLIVSDMNVPHIICHTWWRHQMETFSALLAIRAGIHRSPVTGEFSAQMAFISQVLWTWGMGQMQYQMQYYHPQLKVANWWGHV